MYHLWHKVSDHISKWIKDVNFENMIDIHAGTLIWIEGMSIISDWTPADAHILTRRFQCFSHIPKWKSKHAFRLIAIFLNEGAGEEMILIWRDLTFQSTFRAFHVCMRRVGYEPARYGICCVSNENSVVSVIVPFVFAGPGRPKNSASVSSFALTELSTVFR